MLVLHCKRWSLFGDFLTAVGPDHHTTVVAVMSRAVTASRAPDCDFEKVDGRALGELSRSLRKQDTSVLCDIQNVITIQDQGHWVGGNLKAEDSGYDLRCVKVSNNGHYISGDVSGVDFPHPKERKACNVAQHSERESVAKIFAHDESPFWATHKCGVDLPDYMGFAILYYNMLYIKSQILNYDDLFLMRKEWKNSL